MATPVVLAPFQISTTLDIDTAVLAPFEKLLEEPDEIEGYMDLSVQLMGNDRITSPTELPPSYRYDHYFEVEDYVLHRGLPRTMTATGRITLAAGPTGEGLVGGTVEPEVEDPGATLLLPGQDYHFHPSTTSTHNQTFKVGKKKKITETVIDGWASYPGATKTLRVRFPDTDQRPVYRSQYRFWRGRKAFAPVVLFSTAEVDGDSLFFPEAYMDGRDHLTLTFVLIQRSGGNEMPLFESIAPDGSIDWGVHLVGKEWLKFYDRKFQAATEKYKHIAQVSLKDSHDRADQPIVIGCSLDRVGDRIQVRLAVHDREYRKVKFAFDADVGGALTPNSAGLAIGGDAMANSRKGAIDLLEMRVWENVVTDGNFDSNMSTLANRWGSTK